MSFGSIRTANSLRPDSDDLNVNGSMDDTTNAQSETPALVSERKLSVLWMRIRIALLFGLPRFPGKTYGHVSNAAQPLITDPIVHIVEMINGLTEGDSSS